MSEAEWIGTAAGLDQNSAFDLNISRYKLDSLLSPMCPVRFVLTQQALAEGWDCASAYILVSMAGVKSSTAVEQLLGRTPDAEGRFYQDFVCRLPDGTQQRWPPLM